MPSDDFDKLLKRAFDAEPVPDFERTWQGAKSRARAGKREKPSWRIVWIPVAAMGAAAVAALVLNLPGGSGEETSPSIAKKQGDDVRELLSGLEDPEIKIITLDEYGIDWSSGESQSGGKGEKDEERGVEITSNTLGQGMFESPTDFLLDFEIPKWNGDLKKGVSDEDS